MGIPRRTLAQTTEVVGAGLFTGRPAILRIHGSDRGIRFRRSDLREAPEFAVRIEALAPAPQGMPARNTTLGSAGALVMTVEHVLSALAGMGITDALLELDGPELPIGDGSAGIFVEALTRAGAAELGTWIEPLTIDAEVAARMWLADYLPEVAELDRRKSENQGRNTRAGSAPVTMYGRVPTRTIAVHDRPTAAKASRTDSSPSDRMARRSMSARATVAADAKAIRPASVHSR